ncbi:hypothetical protein ABZ612_09400 [Streptomyces avermitilis]|uniref:hypothetical protein n=1 Tax=Streptomyces avermitilis TaxID=33903 RepID=UPI0033CF9E2C
MNTHDCTVPLGCTPFDPCSNLLTFEVPQGSVSPPASQSDKAEQATETPPEVPRPNGRAVKATYDVKELVSRMLIDEFGPGGWIAENYGDQFNREHLLWTLVLIRSVNGRTGCTHRGDKDIAQSLGYTGNNHPGTETRKLLKKMGFFIETGQKKGRVKELRLSVPSALLDSETYQGTFDDSLV